MRGDAQTVTATIVDLTHDGEGVADIDGRRVFVPDALPGERVEITLRKRRRKLVEASLVRVLEPSPDRVHPKCEYFGRCGGCALQHLAHPAQITFKQGVVAQALARIGRTEPEEWLPPVASPPWGYRRRARLGAKYVAGKERVLVGFRERAGPYLTDMRHCPVLVPPLDGLLGELADLIAGTSIRERLPQIEAAVADGVTALVLRVLAPPSAADAQAFLDFGARHNIDIYLQPGGPGTIAPLGEARTLSYKLEGFGLTLQFLPTDFVQVNAPINAELVATAVRLAAIEPTDRVLDLYCGLGNFSLPLAQRARDLLGVEGEAGLVARAVRNAASNGIGNTRFVTADLSKTDWSFYREPWDIVVLDPPRTGAEAPIAELKRSDPRRIVYVSCHPATLARDAQVLVHERGYRLKVARVFDMFPHTNHIEALALFELASRRTLAIRHWVFSVRRDTMAKLFFAGSLVFALAGPLGAQSVTLSVCNAGKDDIEAFAARENSAVVTHIVPDTCADIYSETTGAPASVGFVLTDTRGQWGTPRRLDLIPDVGNALARVAGNVSVRRGNQNVTAQAQLLFRPPSPKCVTIRSSTNHRDNLPANATVIERDQAESADVLASQSAGKMACDHFVYRVNAVAYPDTREISFEDACAKCPVGEAVNFPLSDAAAEQATRELLATGRSDIAVAHLLDQLKVRLPRPEAQPVTWPVLLPALVKTGWVSGPLPSWIPHYIVLRGTVSRVEVSPPGASVHWVNLAFREAPDTPDSTGKLHAELNVCTSDPEILQDVFGADFRTSMIGRAIEVEGEINREHCQGVKGNIRVTLAHQVRAVQSALFDAATLAAAPVIVPKPDVLPERYNDPNLPNYDIAKSTAQNQINEFCRRLYNYGETLTEEQLQFRNANRAAVDAEVKKCVSEFDAAEAAQHRRIATRYCLANDYTLARAGSNAYDECIQQNDVLTALCSAAQKVPRKGRVPSAAEQKCPAPSPTSREIRVIRDGTPLDGEVKPIVIPANGPGLPAILLAPMEPGMVQRAFPPAASLTPAPAAAPARASAPAAAPAPQRRQAQQQVEDRQARGQQYTTCLQQAAKEYPRGSADLTKAVAACVQILQGR